MRLKGPHEAEGFFEYPPHRFSQTKLSYGVLVCIIRNGLLCKPRKLTSTRHAVCFCAFRYVPMRSYIDYVGLRLVRLILLTALKSIAPHECVASCLSTSISMRQQSGAARTRNYDHIINLLQDLAIPSRQGQSRQAVACLTLRICF